MSPESTKPETATARARGKRRVMTGVVTSDKMDKTVVVQVNHRVKHPAYHKYLTTRVKYKVHAEGNGRDAKEKAFRVGDRVEIVEWRPLSREKRWKVAKLIERPV
jgi:small subunit ribosomal protein S17